MQKKYEKELDTKKNTCTELNIKNSNHKFYYIAFLVTAGLSAPFFEIFTYISSDLNMTLLHNCFMNNINDIGMVDKSGFDMCNREYVDRFNTTLPSIITISVLIAYPDATLRARYEFTLSSFCHMCLQQNHTR